jgi:hypothetical protein
MQREERHGSHLVKSAMLRGTRKECSGSRGHQSGAGEHVKWQSMLVNVDMHGKEGDVATAQREGVHMIRGSRGGGWRGKRRSVS